MKLEIKIVNNVKMLTNTKKLYSSIQETISCPCNEFETTFSSKSGIFNHKKRTHSEIEIVKNLTCDECGKRFPKKHNLTIHVKIVHMKINN